jgi:hypothetical protein
MLVAFGCPYFELYQKSLRNSSTIKTTVYHNDIWEGKPTVLLKKLVY